MERQFIGRGAEHIAFRSSIRPDLVIKAPYWLNALSLRFHKNPAELIRQELKEASTLVEGTNIVIPETHVFSSKSGYIIAQKYIEEDYSLDKAAVLDSLDVTRFKFRRYSPNFISNGGILYWVDPTKPPLHRLLTRTIISNNLFDKASSYLRRIKISLSAKLTI